MTHNSGFALPSPQLPPPAAPSGTDQHNEAKPVNEPPLRHEPRVCAGMCSCHIVDLDFIRPPPQKILVSVCGPGHPRRVRVGRGLSAGPVRFFCTNASKPFLYGLCTGD